MPVLRSNLMYVKRHMLVNSAVHTYAVVREYLDVREYLERS
jgi:hypothetical protein